MSEPDDLYTLRNLFWVGNYQGAINEANGLNKLAVQYQSEKQEFVYRSYVALGQYVVVKNEIQDNDNVKTSLRLIRLLAAYLQDPSTIEDVINKANNLLNGFNTNVISASGYVVGAILHLHNQNVKEALRILSLVPHSVSMEAKALTVQIYLRMDRLDLAQQVVQQLKSMEEDHVLTSLSTAWTHLYMGAIKAQEAAYIYDELIDKYGNSSLLMNGLASAKMHQAHFEEAETILKEAMTKASGDGETFANLIVVSTHLGRSEEVINRYLSQLQAKCPHHQLLQAYATFQNAFDRVSVTYA